jgi:hypothetical protein
VQSGLAGLDHAARTFIDADAAAGNLANGALHTFDETVEGLRQQGQFVTTDSGQPLSEVAIAGGNVLHGNGHT